MEAQDQIAQMLYRRGTANATVLEALDTADERLSDDERREDLYLSILGRYVQALGGRLEVPRGLRGRGDRPGVTPRPGPLKTWRGAPECRRDRYLPAAGTETAGA